jgi:hypothetical protein
VQHLLEGVEDLRAVAHRFAERRRTHRENHELLDVDVVVGVRPTVDDVHHGHRQPWLTVAGERAVERELAVVRSRVRRGQRHRQDCIRAEVRFVLGTVELDHAGVQAALVVGIAPDQGGTDRTVHVGDCVQDTLAQVALGVAIAQLHRLARSGRRPRRHGSAAASTGIEHHIGLDRGVAARIDDFASLDIRDAAHSLDSS